MQANLNADEKELLLTYLGLLEEQCRSVEPAERGDPSLIPAGNPSRGSAVNVVPILETLRIRSGEGPPLPRFNRVLSFCHVERLVEVVAVDGQPVGSVFARLSQDGVRCLQGLRSGLPLEAPRHSTHVEIDRTPGWLASRDLNCLDRIREAVRSLGDSGHVEMARAMGELTNRVVEDTTLDARTLRRVLIHIRDLGFHAMLAPEERAFDERAQASLAALEEAVIGEKGCAGAWSTCGPVMKAFFGR